MGKGFKKYFEFLSIPASIIILIIWSLFAQSMGWHSFTWDKIGKVFLALLLFLISFGMIRIVYLFMFRPLYRYFDVDFDEFKQAWEKLGSAGKLFFALGVFFLLSDLFKAIIASL